MVVYSVLSQAQRIAALQRFKSNVAPVMIATDVASRGLDIPTVDLVVNYDLPRVAKDYVHRVGRTARAGRMGSSVSLITQYDVEQVQRIEGVIKRKLEECKLNEKEVLKGMTKVFQVRNKTLFRTWGQ
jgi:ATP-dependent RNA helicase DDX49/DBP8